MDHGFWEWVAFILGGALAVLIFVPWSFVLSSWWALGAFLAWPAFIWIVSRL